MRRNWAIGILSMCLLLTGSFVRAQDSIWQPRSPLSQLLAQAQPAAQPEPPPADLFTQAPAQAPSGSSDSGAGHPQMLGDLNGGIFVRRTLTFPTVVSLRVVKIDPETEKETIQNIRFPSTVTREVNVPLSSRGAFKIAENESPFPTNRVYMTYNYFNNIAVPPTGGAGVPPLASLVNSRTFDPQSLGPDVSAVDVVGSDPARALQRLDVHREVFGFERTLFGDNFSVGVRLPLIQQRGEPTLESSRLGDVSVLFKYALINGTDSGNVLSGGLVVTAPTGEDVFDADGRKIHSTLLQPYMGFFANFGQFYFHGFSAVIFPTEFSDSTLFCNDAGMGYRLYEDVSGSGFVRSITPTLEGHLTTPLDNRGASSTPAGFPDIFIATGGLHIGLGGGASLTAGVTTPLTGPRPFDVEAAVQFNLRF